jgi:hypothetical protein
MDILGLKKNLKMKREVDDTTLITNPDSIVNNRTEVLHISPS